MAAVRHQLREVSRRSSSTANRSRAISRATHPIAQATVYLPPTYASEQSRRFPVIYLLHGYGGQEDTFTERLASLQQSSDTLAAAQGFSSAIVVTPSAYTLHKGSMYSNSPTTGDWERFIADDLVAYMDSHYRTLANRMSRGLAGHSMGGYGALRIGMKRPDVFFSLYLMSSCCLTANRNPNPESMAASEAIKTREQAVEAASGRGFGPSVNLASAAAWSPNPKNPPLFLDLPIKDGKVRPDIVAKWVANAPIEMLEQHADNLRKYYAIAIEIGTSDGLLASNKQLHETMASCGFRTTTRSTTAITPTRSASASSGTCCRSSRRTWPRRRTRRRRYREAHTEEENLR